ncbi:MAG: FG-GAP repeat protein [Myxococcota bacterium]
MGSAIAGGDVDGDGQDDLVVGASGVYPGTFRGAVLLFLGPRDAAALTADDADARIQGENVHDFFGALALVDADGDARQDLLIGATGWPSDQYRGAVYPRPRRGLAPIGRERVWPPWISSTASAGRARRSREAP